MKLSPQNMPSVDFKIVHETIVESTVWLTHLEINSREEVEQIQERRFYHGRKLLKSFEKQSIICFGLADAGTKETSEQGP